MGVFTCARAECGVSFESKHSTAKYCSRACSNKVNVGNIAGATRPRRFSNEEILEAIRDLAQQLGKVPSQRDFEKHVSMSGRTVQYHFGSWNQAVELAGFTPNLAPPPSFGNDERRVGWSTRFRVLERDGFRCTYCGGTPAEGYVLHVDHITPRSKGGEATEDNLRTACHLCNMGRGADIGG